MAQDLGFDIAATPIATITFGADIAAGASNTSTAVDLTGGAGTVVPGEVGIALTMAMGAGTPDGNQQYKLKALWSLDGVGFTDAEFGVNIDIGDVVASQTDTKHFTIPVYGIHLKILTDNDQLAGPALLTATSEIKVFEIYGDQA